MGLFSHSSPATIAGPLLAFDPPLGLDPSFAVGHQTMLTIQTHNWAGNSEITDSNGTVVVLCEGNTMGTHKEYKHATTGRLLFKVETNTMSQSWTGLNSGGGHLFETKAEVDWKAEIGFGRTQLRTQLVNTSTGQQVELVLAAQDRSNNYATVVLGGRTVATINHDSSTFSSPPHSMTVAPGVDLALMAAICICYAGIVRRRKGVTNASLASFI